jgi:hypothetical protein
LPVRTGRHGRKRRHGKIRKLNVNAVRLKNTRVLSGNARNKNIRNGPLRKRANTGRPRNPKSAEKKRLKKSGT